MSTRKARRPRTAFPLSPMSSHRRTHLWSATFAAPAPSSSAAPIRPNFPCGPRPSIHCTGAPGTRGIPMRLQGDLPEAPGLPQPPGSARSITATTSPARCGSLPSPMAWRRSSRHRPHPGVQSVGNRRAQSAWQLTSVQGAIARTVADVRLATRVMAGGDVRDPWWVPAPFDGEPLQQPFASRSHATVTDTRCIRAFLS